MKCNIHISILRKAAVLSFLMLTLTLGACVKNLVHPSLDVTFLPQKGDFVSKSGERLSFAEIIEMARDKDYILLGEGHKNICDHKVQQRVLAGLATTDYAPSVGLEMVAVDMQPVLDDFGKGQVEIDALEEELQWSTKWGYSYSLFAGLFEIANRNSLPVAGLNVPTHVTKKITKEGIDALTEEERALLPTEIVPPSSAQTAFLDMIYSQHTSLGDDNATQRERFFLVQSIWDSKMAEEAVRMRKKYDWPVLIIAGGGHVENGWGIAHRIKQFDPGAKILTLMPWRGGEFDNESGDAFFYCPETYESRMGASLTATGMGGLLVESVKRGSRAAKAGLRPGDVLLEAAGIQLDYLFSLHMAGSKAFKSGEDFVYVVRRGGETFTANVGKLGGTQPKDHPKTDAESTEDAEPVEEEKGKPHMKTTPEDKPVEG